MLCIQIHPEKYRRKYGILFVNVILSGGVLHSTVPTKPGETYLWPVRLMTMETIENRVISKINEASTLYYQLILIVAPSGSGKTAILQNVMERTGAELININLELSRYMLNLTMRQRVLQLPHFLNEAIKQPKGGNVLLDNIELLFDVHLKQDPLRLLQDLSRNKTLTVAWSGEVTRDHITYAAPEHQEYRKYKIKDFLVVDLGVKT